MLFHMKYERTPSYMIKCHSLSAGCIVGWVNEEMTWVLLILNFPSGHILWKYNLQGYSETPP